MGDVFRELARLKSTARSGNFDAVFAVLQDILASTNSLGAHWAEIVMIAGDHHFEDLAAHAAKRLFDENSSQPMVASIYARALAACGASEDVVSVLSPFAASGSLNYADRMLLARAYAFLGRPDGAESELRRLIVEKPTVPFAWEFLTQVKMFVEYDEDVRAIEKLTEVLRTSDPSQRAAINYARAKTMFDLNQDRQLLDALSNASAARSEQQPFNVQVLKELEEAAIGAAADAGLNGPSSGDDVDPVLTPIFVLGVPRSGTTLVEQLLARAADATAGGELKFLWLATRAFGGVSPSTIHGHVHQERQAGRSAWRRVKERYCGLAKLRFGDVQILSDKLLSNYFRLAFIRRAFPKARVVWCRRSPVDVAWSCWRSNFGADMSWSTSPEHIARYIRGYEQVMKHWCEAVPGWVVEIDYESLVADPAKHVSSLVSSLALQPSRPVKARAPCSIETLSFGQARQGIYSTAVGSAERFPISTARLTQSLAEERLI